MPTLDTNKFITPQMREDYLLKLGQAYYNPNLDSDCVPHIIENGSRRHVISYHLENGEAVEKCSEKNCEKNKR